MAKLVVRDKFLKHIYDEMDFGPDINAAIERRLNPSPMFNGWPEVGSNSGTVRLPNTPEWMGYVSFRADHSVAVVTWEHVDDFDGNIVFNRVSGRSNAFVQWGCKRFANEKSMRDRFHHEDDDPDNAIVSKHSGEERPHAFELVDWCKAVCQRYGWEW
jgi:hypothetical protein